MLLTEWNIDDAIAVAREEGEERGLERGLEQGREQGLEQGREQGLEQGLEQGRDDIRFKVFELLDQGLSADEIRQQIKR